MKYHLQNTSAHSRVGWQMVKSAILIFSVSGDFLYRFNLFVTKKQGCTSCASLAVRKWRENEKMKRKWRENEEMEGE